jgi:transposase InsO family protein
MVNDAGWRGGVDRVQRIWRREGLKVPRKQPKRGRLWLNDGSCIRLRPERRNHVWSYDFVEAQTHDGRKVRLMTLIDEFTRECLAIRVARRINSLGIIETMADVMLVRGVPEHIRSDNGPEMPAKVMRNGWPRSGPKPSTSSLEAPGRTDTANPSTASCAMSFSTEKYSTA